MEFKYEKEDNEIRLIIIRNKIEIRTEHSVYWIKYTRGTRKIVIRWYNSKKLSIR